MYANEEFFSESN